MKWAKINPKAQQTQGKTPKLTPEEIAEAAESVVNIDKSERDYLYQQGFKEWLVCTKEKYPKISEFRKNKHAMRNYEAYLGGFLYYFEKYDSLHSTDERTLFIDWGDDKNNEVTIYLKPLYKPYYDEKRTQIRWDNTNNNSHFGGNINITIHRSPLAPPPEGGQTDPPQPPGFPPPPRNFND